MTAAQGLEVEVKAQGAHCIQGTQSTQIAQKAKESRARGAGSVLTILARSRVILVGQPRGASAACPLEALSAATQRKEALLLSLSLGLAAVLVDSALCAHASTLLTALSSPGPQSSLSAKARCSAP